MTPDGRLNEIDGLFSVESILKMPLSVQVFSAARVIPALAQALRDARAGSITANEILGRIHDALGLGWNPADDDHAAAWCDSEDTVQGVIRSVAELRAARAELAAERAKVALVKEIHSDNGFGWCEGCGFNDNGAWCVRVADCRTRAALAGGDLPRWFGGPKQ